MKSGMKTCLVISYGPVPTPQYQKIEGGGMRCWGIANGLKANGYDVTVGVNESFPLDVHTCDDIHLINWREDNSFIEQLNLFDVVIVNYSMGGPMTFIVNHISDHVTLVLDCYVPIYIEVSARESNDIATEYSNYSHDILHWNKALMRGDYFLCANEPQKHMYMGALGALGILNPYSYKTPRILLVPFGVESTLEIPNPRNPYRELGIQKNDFVLLWFGGLYPWFNIKPLLQTIKRLGSEYSNFRFVIVGGKNPYNSHPDFVKQYDDTYSFFEKNKLIDSVVYFVDWVDFNDRFNWFQNANLLITINNLGDENTYSWRTRVMDFVGGGIPMLTNGGDPLSDSLIAHDAALPLADTTEQTLYDTLAPLVKDQSKLQDVRSALQRERSLYHWDKVVKPLDEALQRNEKPYLNEKIFKQSYKPDTIEQVARGGVHSKIKKLARAPRKIARIVKQKGVRRSAKLIVSTIKNSSSRAVRVRNKRYYLFSHPIDYTGAPLVLIDIVRDFIKHDIPRGDINLVYPGGEKPLLTSLHKLGIIMDKMVMGIGSRVIHAQLGIRRDDFVLLNTVAVYPNYRDYVLGLLDNGKLHQATWFIHEDKPEIRFEDQGLVKRISNLINSGKLRVVVPSKQTAREYNVFFNTNAIETITLRVEVPEKYITNRKERDFSKLRFVLSGTSSDGRKGQLLAISALAKLQHEVVDKDPSSFRDYELHLIAVGKDDYVSDQIRSIGKGLLDKKLFIYPTVPKSKAMEITAKCNVTICCSLNETFALFVAEGMLMGHPLLRNKSSGHDEQIKNGKNGLIINELDIDDFTQKLKTLLDKQTSNAQLLSMGQSSQKIAQKFRDSDYYFQILG